MSLKDKLEIGLKPDAPYRQDNLPDFQQDDPACVEAAEPGDAEAQKRAREECANEGERKDERKGPKRTDGVPGE